MGIRSEKAIRLKEKTASSFGFEWERFNDVFAEYESNFLSYIDPIDKDFFKDKTILDAGCGAGRHSYYAAMYGADVTAFDLSVKAVMSTRRNTKELPNVEVQTADIYHLPDEWYRKFDCILCIGVLHHLPDPQQGFNKLIPLLKPGGVISIWVYGKRDNKLVVYLYEPLRKISTRLPHRLLYYIALLPAIATEILNKLKLPLFRHYARFPFRTKWNDAFDVLSAPSAKCYTTDDIQGWFELAGLRDIQVSCRILDGVAKGIKGRGTL